jgi:recombinational DNA repair protein (RecF pathway)
MRHKYVTRAIVLQRFPARESGLMLTLLTEDFGLVRAKAEGLRKSGAKLASALQTLCECDVTFVRGKDGWRLTGALLSENRFRELSVSARSGAARVAALFLRLMPPDAHEAGFFALYRDFIGELRAQSVEEQETAECTTALSLLVMLGLDTGPSVETLSRNETIVRINRGIAASGL